MADQHLFLKISHVLYVGLATNVLLVAFSLPLLGVVGLTNPAQGLLPLAGALILAVPGLPAAFEVFRQYSDEGSVTVVRTFVGSWWHNLRRSLTVGGLAVGAILVLVIDVLWAWGRQIGAVTIPFFVIAATLAAAVALGTLVGLVERPELSLRALARAALFLMVRRWYLTALSFVGLAALFAIFVEQPALGLGVATAPLLYVVWTNTRHCLTPIMKGLP